MKKKVIAVTLAVLSMLTFSSCTQKNVKKFTNPVYNHVFADPSIIRAKDGTFYAYATEDDWGDGKGERHIPIIKSKDLVNWDYVGEAFKEKPTWRQGAGLWAPDIRYVNGKYYLYYSYAMWGSLAQSIGVAVADKPEGPFIDKGEVINSSDIGVPNSIDQSFFEDGGKKYLFWGSFNGIYGIQLSDDGLKTVGEKFQVAGEAFEGPYIIKKDGYFYFFGSAGTC